MTNPDLSVIVVTHNGRDRALATLHSAHERTGPISVEWIVIDNGSEDGTPDAVEQQFSRVEVVRQDNAGFAAANNVGLRRSRGRYILLLNPDIDIADGTLAELVAALDDRPQVGVASVIQRAPDGTLQTSMRRYPSPWRAFGAAIGPAAGCPSPSLQRRSLAGPGT